LKGKKQIRPPDGKSKYPVPGKKRRYLDPKVPAKDFERVAHMHNAIISLAGNQGKQSRKKIALQLLDISRDFRFPIRLILDNWVRETGDYAMLRSYPNLASKRKRK